MMYRLLPALLLLVAVPARAEIYMWVDEEGHTQFSESVPEKYRKSSSTLTPRPMNTIKGSELRGKPLPPANAPATATTSEQQCQLDQERYRQSLECFERYRGADGNLRPEAKGFCESVPQPKPCEE